MRVIFICKDITDNNIHLQPWYFIYNLALGFSGLGHDVAIISNKYMGNNCNNLQYIRCESFTTKNICRIITFYKPNLVIWNYGVTSSISFTGGRMLGNYKSAIVFSSPKYTFKELMGALHTIGFGNTLLSLSSLVLHFIGALIPWFIIQQNLRLNNISNVITLSSLTTTKLSDIGIKSYFTLPIVNFNTHDGNASDKAKEVLGIPASSVVILYAGNPLPLRGGQLLIEAFTQALKNEPDLYLVMLLRSERSFQNHITGIKSRIANAGIEHRTLIVEKSVSDKEMAMFFNLADVVALPFILVPSEAPITILEVHQAGKPVVTCDIAGLSDMLLQGDLLVKPHDTDSLAMALSSRTWSRPAIVPNKSWQDIASGFLHYLKEE